MRTRILIKIYAEEQDVFDMVCAETKNKPQVALFYMIKKGIELWKEETRTTFTTSFVIPVYPKKQIIHEQYLIFQKEDEILQFIETMARSQQITRSAVCRYFITYYIHYRRR